MEKIKFYKILPIRKTREDYVAKVCENKKINQNNCWLAFDKQVSFAMDGLIANIDKSLLSVHKIYELSEATDLSTQ